MELALKTFYTLLLCWSLPFALIAKEPLSFSDSIRPILSENCFHCHGPDENDRNADLRLDTPEGLATVLTAGKVEESELIHRIFSDDADDIMPPPKSKLTLTTKEKDLLKKWIAEGAKFEEHWSFLKPVRPEVPSNQNNKNPIDAFIQKRLADEGLTFSNEAPAHRLIRRLTLDLTGLPPTEKEVDQFISDYAKQGDTAYEATVDRLLASPRYGENMALPWLDAARFADTDGYQYDGPRVMWRWRDWVINAYNQKLPFDQFTIEQLAGDLLENPTLDQRIATGFNRNHRYNSEEGLVIEEFLLENAVDRVDTTSTLWMGLTMGCARCHDHKYDPISQKDYYQMIAFFNNINEAGRAVKPSNSEPIIKAPTATQQTEIARLEKAIADAKEALKPGEKPQNGGLLIDRSLTNHFALDQLPSKNAKVDGKAGFKEKALFLDGKSQVQLSGISKDVPLRTNQPFTISFWVKPESLDDSIILSRQKPGTTRPGIEIAITEKGRLRFDLVSRWISGLGRVITHEKLPINQWTHITLVSGGDHSANSQLIYFDSRRIETEVTHNTNSNTGGVTEKQALIVGGGIRPGSNRFKGGIRDIRLFSTNLWPEEIDILAAKYGGEKRVHFSKIKATPAYPKYVAARLKLAAYLKSVPTVMVMKEASKPRDTFVRNRGVYHDYGEKVPREVPGKFPPMSKDLPKNRLGFAKWLLSEDHPLTSRVAVNRYWQKYFGVGLVKTAEDFGVQGEAPSHPDLLDWLAVEFREGGWDVAHIQKLIVTSRTYRQDSTIQHDLLKRDPENRLLARGPRIRLSGHAIRDQALYVSGLLKEQIGGPSVSPYQPTNLWAEMSMGIKYKQSKGDSLYRRSLYTIWKRTVAPPTMAVFDAADREACWINRKETNTPLQALTLLNETGFVESARHLAVEMLTHSADDPIGFAFKRVTGREISDREKSILEKALDGYQNEFAGNKEEAQKLISTGASPMNKDFPPEQIAAYTAIANILLNLDEAITRE